MRKSWWKIVSFILLAYTLIMGFAGSVPKIPILYETIRNLYFHVSMWFVMMILLFVSFIYAIKVLRSNNLKEDILSNAFASVGAYAGLLGYITGFMWASQTWVTEQTHSYASILKEPKLIGAAIALLMYAAYFILRNAIPDVDKRARISAVYNIFAFAMLFPTIWVIPRLVGSLHPGAPGDTTGNPALNFNDIDSRLRMVFYPAVIGWTLLGVWISTLQARYYFLKYKPLLSVDE